MAWSWLIWSLPCFGDALFMCTMYDSRLWSNFFSMLVGIVLSAHVFDRIPRAIFRNILNQKMYEGSVYIKLKNKLVMTHQYYNSWKSSWLRYFFIRLRKGRRSDILKSILETCTVCYHRIQNILKCLLYSTISKFCRPKYSQNWTATNNNFQIEMNCTLCGGALKTKIKLVRRICCLYIQIRFITNILHSRANVND